MGVCLAVVVVEDHDGGDHAARHHEHDAVEVGSCHLIYFNRSNKVIIFVSTYYMWLNTLC